MTTGGHWATVSVPGVGAREDWIPAEQPPPPGDVPGTWHVVRDLPDAEPRWEWHPAPSPAPARPERNVRRGLLAKAPSTGRSGKPLPWPAATAIGVATAVAVGGVLAVAGDSDAPPAVVAGPDAPLTPGPSGAAADPHGAETVDAAGRPADPATGSATSAARVDPTVAKAVRAAAERAGTPLTWQQQVALEPTGPIRLEPVAADWTADEIVIGTDLARKLFLGRAVVRYTGPGSAGGTFAVTLLKGDREITTLTGTLDEVRSGTYSVLLRSDASFVEGPWTTRFRVTSTA